MASKNTVTREDFLRSPAQNHVVLDVETTGWDPEKKAYDVDKDVWEIAIVELNRITLDEESVYETLIFTEKTHMINDKKIDLEDVKKAKKFSELQGEIFKRLDGKVWWGHNVASFDSHVLRKQYERNNLVPPKPLAIFDTLIFLRRVWPKELTLDGHKLASFNRFFKMKKQSHRALQDVRDTIEVIKRVSLLMIINQIPSVRDASIPIKPEEIETYQLPTITTAEKPPVKMHEVDPDFSSDKLPYKVQNQTTEEKVAIIDEALGTGRQIVFHYMSMRNKDKAMEQRGNVVKWEEKGRKFSFRMRNKNTPPTSRLVESIMDDIKFFNEELLRGRKPVKEETSAPRPSTPALITGNDGEQLLVRRMEEDTPVHLSSIPTLMTENDGEQLPLRQMEEVVPRYFLNGFKAFAIFFLVVCVSYLLGLWA